MSKDGLKAKSMVRDGMKIEIDVPIPMDDGLTLSADVYRPVAEGRYPVLINYGPYAKGLPFQEAYQARNGTRWTPSTRTCSPDRPTSTRLGGLDPRSGCPTAMSASASIHAARAARRVYWTSGRRGRRRTSTSASNGRRSSPGATAGSG